VDGRTIEHHLRTASDSLFPAALASQEAQAGFQKVTKDYKDAQKVTAALQVVLAKMSKSSKRGGLGSAEWM
jgi:hypothetical protein